MSEKTIKDDAVVDTMISSVEVTTAIVEEKSVVKIKEDVPESVNVSDKKKFYYTKKVCKYCTKQIDEKMVNYKNVELLRRFIMPSGKILPRRISGNCAKHQRKIVIEVKKARIVALLPIMDR